MATVTSVASPLGPALVLPGLWTAADMQQRLGGVPLERILMVPPPGTATVEDVERVRRQTGRICELVDGILVEKPVGYYGSRIAVVLGHMIEGYLDTHDLGMTLGEAGTLEILSDIVRAADVAYIGWDRIPGEELPEEPVPDLVPDLAVEVLSKSHTPREMERKLREYFEAGVRLVWFIDPKAQTALVYTAPDQCSPVEQDGTLSGGDVLPGFEVPLKEVFERASRRQRRPENS
jgi:Uma2 family endonuclease